MLPTRLRAAGAEVVDVVAYETVLASDEKDDGPDIYEILLEQRVDVVTFTSTSSVRNLVKILGTEPAADLLSTTVVAAIGPVTAAAAAKLDIDVTIVPDTYTVPALVDAIAAYFSSLSPSGKEQRS